jgi:hypothetical protein
MANDESNFIDNMMPPWCEPGTRPEWLTAGDGGGVCAWARGIGPTVWVALEDTVERGGCGPGRR